MKLVRQTATVKGHGQFPIDMLRYDHCWPKTDDDSERIVRSIDRISYPEDVEVTLERKAPKGHAWTLDRWKSFRYVVVHTTEDRQ